MFNFLRKLWNDRRGNALIIAGAALPLVVGSAGLATDTIQWALWKRQLQRAADSAALAGVYAKVQGAASQTATQAVDADLAQNHHTNITLLGGYPEVTFPTGTGWKDGVKVTLAIQKKLGFSSIFLPDPPIVKAEATAATIETGVYCVVSLIETGDTGIKATGNGNINLGCGMITNSTSLAAAIATGSSEVYATPIAAVGNIGASDKWNGAELLPFTVKQEDPFKDVNPDASMCTSPVSQLKVNANQLHDRTANVGETVCFSSMVLNGTVKLATDATYVIDGGDLSIGAQAVVSCTRCVFVLTNKSTSPTATIGQVNINGGARVNLTSPTSGTYKDILIFQDRRASSAASAKNIINGNSLSTLQGAFYFPKQQLEVNGGGSMSFSCAQFVAYIVEFSGNSGISNTCAGGYGSKSIKGRHVRLVA